MRSVEPAELGQPRLGACFPLAPYSNRLGYRHFRWQGCEYTTAANFEGCPHSLHGVAWQRAWVVSASSAGEAELQLEHAADAGWPFAFALSQRFVLTPEALEVSMHFTNRAPGSQPVGLGWHPYFPRRMRSRLHVELSDRWDSDACGLPTRRVAQPGIDTEVASLDLDNCFEGWRGPARLLDETLSLRLSSSLPYLVVYTPPGQAYYCVEPVGHVNNAIQMTEPAAHGLCTLAPQATLQAWMKLEIGRV